MDLPHQPYTQAEARSATPVKEEVSSSDTQSGGAPSSPPGQSPRLGWTNSLRELFSLFCPGSGADNRDAENDFDVPKKRGNLAYRLDPWIKDAIEREKKFNMKARKTKVLMIIANMLQLLLGALTTGVSAAAPGRKASLVTAVFGGILTMVASYIARVHSSCEPERSIALAEEYRHFLLEVRAAVRDRGWVVNGEKQPGQEGESSGSNMDTIDKEVEKLRGQFEAIMEKAKKQNEHNVSQA